jgi:hypothetical protein
LMSSDCGGAAGGRRKPSGDEQQERRLDALSISRCSGRQWRRCKAVGVCV